MEKWQSAVTEAWNQKLKAQKRDDNYFPLIDQTFDAEEIVAVMDVVMSSQLTMSERVRTFEKQFAAYVGAPYAVMVNSGSSANLLAFAVAANTLRKEHLKVGDEVLVPAVCWSTSVWPIVQMGLKPVFVDVDPQTLNMSLRDVEKKLSPRTKAVLAVHILGNCTNMSELTKLTQDKGLILIEDTCESLGSTYSNKKLGSIGDFGTYSFYYSHHMTTGEGGMVVCKTLEDYDLLKCLRAHGWSRELSNKADLEKQYSEVDSRFLFVNVGYNVRPMEMQAALGLCQLKKLETMNHFRVENRAKLISALKAHPKWNEQFIFTQASEHTSPIWFGFCALLGEKYVGKRSEFLSYLSSNGIENRPVVSGNFVRQPALSMLGLKLKPEDFPGAEEIHESGFFIGLHTTALTEAQISRLCDVFLSFSF